MVCQLIDFHQFCDAGEMEAEIGTGRLYAAGNFAASVVLWFATKHSNNKRFCTATIFNCIQNRPQRRVDTFVQGHSVSA